LVFRRLGGLAVPAFLRLAILLTPDSFRAEFLISPTGRFNHGIVAPSFEFGNGGLARLVLDKRRYQALLLICRKAHRTPNAVMFGEGKELKRMPTDWPANLRLDDLD
jgi:hypothetical protein